MIFANNSLYVVNYAKHRAIGLSYYETLYAGLWRH